MMFQPIKTTTPVLKRLSLCLAAIKHQTRLKIEGAAAVKFKIPTLQKVQAQHEKLSL